MASSIEKICGDCEKRLTEECSLYEYKDYELNVAACPETAEACEKFKATKGLYFDERGKFIPKLLADEIMSEHNFLTMMDNEEIYVYLDGYYQPLGEVLIKKECKDKLLDEYRKNRAIEVIDYIKVSTYTRRREEPPPAKLQLELQHRLPLRCWREETSRSKEPYHRRIA